jgi:hypothetical protein
MYARPQDGRVSATHERHDYARGRDVPVALGAVGAFAVREVIPA